MNPRKKHILEQAAALFKEKGYTASSMRDLADRVGLEPSSLYNHIRSKAEILREICLTNAERFTDGMKSIRASGAGPSEQLCELVRLHVRIATEDNSSITVFNDEWKHLDEESLKAFLKMRKEYEKALISILEEGLGTGAWYKHNVFVLMQSLLSSLRWVHQFYRPEKMGSPDDLADEIATIWLKGLEK